MAASALGVPAAGPIIYRRREPQKLVLYQAVKEHLPGFLAAAEEAERTVPAFVRRELEAFLDCGLIEKGTTVTYYVQLSKYVGRHNNNATPPPPAWPDVRGAQGR